SSPDNSVKHVRFRPRTATVLFLPAAVARRAARPADLSKTFATHAGIIPSEVTCRHARYLRRVALCRGLVSLLRLPGEPNTGLGATVRLSDRSHRLPARRCLAGPGRSPLSPGRGETGQRRNGVLEPFDRLRNARLGSRAGPL